MQEEVVMTATFATTFIINGSRDEKSVITCQLFDLVVDSNPMTRLGLRIVHISRCLGDHIRIGL